MDFFTNFREYPKKKKFIYGFFKGILEIPKVPENLDFLRIFRGLQMLIFIQYLKGFRRRFLVNF